MLFSFFFSLELSSSPLCQSRPPSLSSLLPPLPNLSLSTTFEPALLKARDVENVWNLAEGVSLGGGRPLPHTWAALCQKAASACLSGKTREWNEGKYWAGRRGGSNWRGGGGILQQWLKGSGIEVIGRRQRCRLAIFHHSVPLSSSLLPLQSVLSVCLYLPPPLPAGSNSCGRKWRAKVSSHCSICTPACAPVSRLTPAHSSFSTPNYPQRWSMLQSAFFTCSAREAVKRDGPHPENGSFITLSDPRSDEGDMF